MQELFSSVSTRPLRWIVGSVVEVAHEGKVAFVHEKKSDEEGDFEYMTADELPVEFFNHELMEVKISDRDSLIRFVSKWGFIFSPYRNSTVRSTFKSVIDLTESFHELDTSPSILLVKGRTQFDSISDHIISLDEITLSIRVMQDAVRVLMEQIEKSSDGFYVYSDTINSAAMNVRIITRHSNYRFCEGNRNIPGGGLLVSAICNQIIECIADENPWKKCECEGCGKWFKYQHTNSRSRSPHRDSKYCSVKCSNRQRKRNQRLAASSRADHGL